MNTAIKEKPHRTLLFDLDDTIFDFHRAEAEALSKTLTSFGIVPSREAVAHYSRVNDAQWKRLEKGELTREQVLFSRFEIFFSEVGITVPAKEAQLRYETLLGSHGYYLDGAEELLRELKPKYRLIAMSNGTARVQKKRIEHSGVGNYFERIFISETVGYNKPDRRFFDACFAALSDVRKEDCLLIGDSLSSDILGGKNAGIATLWYNPHGKKAPDGLRPDYEVSALDTIPLVAEMFFAERN